MGELYADGRKFSQSATLLACCVSVLLHCLTTSGTANACSEIYHRDPRLVLRPFEKAVSLIALSPLASKVAAGDGGSRVTLIDARTGVITIELKLNERELHTAAFSPNEQTLAVHCAGPLIRWWNVASGSEGGEITPPPRQSKDRTYAWLADYSFALAFSPTRLDVASGHPLGVRIWSLKERRMSREVRVPNGASALRYSSDGEQLAIGTGWGGVYLMDCESGRTRRLEGAHTRPVSGVCFVQSGTRLATASEDHRLIVSDVATGRKINILHEDKPDTGCHDRIYASMYAQCSNVLVTASADNTVRVWALKSGKLVRKVSLNLLGHRVSRRAMVLAPSPPTLAIGADDGFVLVYDLGNDVPMHADLSEPLE
jgi:WD40 repeat protein